MKIHPADIKVRRETFEDADSGFSKPEGYAEASRCMRCYRVIRFYTAKPIANVVSH